MDSATNSPISFYLQWEEVEGSINAKLISRFMREGSPFFENLNGAQVIRDNWIHCAMCATGDGARLFQNGNGYGSFGWSDMVTEPVDRIGLGGLMRPEWDDKIKDWPCAIEMDELRILPQKAAYGINSPTYEIPTGPFTA